MEILNEKQQTLLTDARTMQVPNEMWVQKTHHLVKQNKCPGSRSKSFPISFRFTQIRVVSRLFVTIALYFMSCVIRFIDKVFAQKKQHENSPFIHISWRFGVFVITICSSIDEHSIFLCAVLKYCLYCRAVGRTPSICTSFDSVMGHRKCSWDRIHRLAVHSGRKLNLYLSNTICVIGCDKHHISNDLSIITEAFS